MTRSELLRQRLINQQIASTSLTKPEEIVSKLVAMQSQAYGMAKWAIGLRLPKSTDAMIESKFNDGSILRTHVMRPTWHFVSPRDIRWLLELTAPRVHQVSAYYYRKEGLDKKIFKRSNDILAKALEGENYLTRTELQKKLADGKIEANGLRLGYLMFYAELEGVICSGPRRGKQFTYALRSERAPNAIRLEREESLAELALRYFTTRGPATAHDFAWWSGLTIADAKQGIASLPKEFVSATYEDRDYHFLPHPVKGVTPLRSTFLMPDYEEFGLSYMDRSALKSDSYDARGLSPYKHWLVVDGKIEGTWDRVEKEKTISVDVTPFGKLTKTQLQAVDLAVARYIEFHQG